ncbi:zwei Ig domain protein zig-8 isoform X3 [Agrilus planipennis]|uniref:Zwei Ig domain protein zig-8 isoform X3 n=1 Tax=Agrilus planipennis TaxID=224129 RepID=A0A7F5R5N8_AGRPL|nr:zwei Ig domain protein zig-8 isoform X3 [Agrilus planipennis]XP_025831109.1 zwei Ig domain protein zig-8 isoform X3 [Agrilus planipennis]XP_025831113.1 zwei Ig domain protein zig-8 isoform X3 [Agrilus planipennis]
MSGKLRQEQNRCKRSRTHYNRLGLLRSRRNSRGNKVAMASGIIGIPDSLDLNVEYLPIPTHATITEHEGHSAEEPYFDPTVPRDVNAFRGKTAYLSCRIYNMGNRTVSWIRHADVHIISVGTYTYTSDQRYFILHDNTSGDWTLQIKWVSAKDEGTYGCQLNTQPIKSYYIMLTVVGKMPDQSTYPESWWEKENNLQHRMLADVANVPAAYIANEGDMYVSLGSTLNLSCILNTSDSQLFWYHDGEIINYDSLRGGITIIVEKSNITVSTLHIKNTSIEDSGNYTCSPSNANSASTVVHVIKGECFGSLIVFVCFFFSFLFFILTLIYLKCSESVDEGCDASVC